MTSQPSRDGNSLTSPLGVPGVSDLSPAVVAQVINRAASPLFEEWWTQVADSGFCAVPVRLVGRDGPLRSVEVMARCKNRRASVCPSCSQLYAGDTWQLVHAGIEGEGRAPVALGGHPMVFATLTAPSFGPVHSARRNSAERSPRPCHPGETNRACGHGRPLACSALHALADPVVGEPLCADCYDYLGHVLFTWHAPRLWHRFGVAMRRLVAQRSREIGEDPSGVRVAYVKVVEMQRRALPHFHTVIRLDPATDPGEAPAPPDSSLDAAELAGLVHRACARVSLGVNGPGGTFTVRFGQQVDVQPLVAVIAGVGSESGLVAVRSDLSGRRVAAYLAKYVTKSVSDFGIGARRLHEGSSANST